MAHGAGMPPTGLAGPRRSRSLQPQRGTARHDCRRMSGKQHSPGVWAGVGLQRQAFRACAGGRRGRLAVGDRRRYAGEYPAPGRESVRRSGQGSKRGPMGLRRGAGSTCRRCTSPLAIMQGLGWRKCASPTARRPRGDAKRPPLSFALVEIEAALGEHLPYRPACFGDFRPALRLQEPHDPSDSQSIHLPTLFHHA